MRGSVDWGAVALGLVLLAVLAVAVFLAYQRPAESAVYVPVVIAAAAGLGGAWLGGRAATRAARVQVEAEQRAWTRERRSHAYLTFLEARNTYVEVQLAKGQAMQEWMHGSKAQPFDWEPHQRSVEAGLQALRQARANVELFGSRAARARLDGWWHMLLGAYQMATRPGGTFGGSVREVERLEIQDHRDPFLDLIRPELLGSDD